MPPSEIEVSCPIHRSFRTAQIAGMFDLPEQHEVTERFSYELPSVKEPWQIGLIVGPSGSGKSTVARTEFGDAIDHPTAWPDDQAIIDCFADLTSRQATALLTAVGFSSPPSWIKPYSVLSRGEQFRCDLARAIAAAANHEDRLVVFDEFTSVVDRDVARIASAAVSRQIRCGHLKTRFVAVTCHYDVARWLEPDWTLDMANGQLSRRRLRRPRLELSIYRVGRAPWQSFKRHHYLSGSLARAARCYLGVWVDPVRQREVPVAFAATIPILGQHRHRRFTRIVVLPDYQGIGIGMKFTAGVARLHRQEGLRISVTTSHPAVVQSCLGSSQWRLSQVKRHGSSASTKYRANYRSSAGRAVASFEYVGKR